jgi:hypothetical protein
MKFLRVGLGLDTAGIGFVVSLVMLLFFRSFLRPTILWQCGSGCCVGS